MHSVARDANEKARQAGLFDARSEPADQRLLNCLRRRAECRPTFLRSTSRASRVTKPAADSWGFRVASQSISAQVMPWRTAPAWPDSPPPCTLHWMSNVSAWLVSISGCFTIMIEVWRPKKAWMSLPLTVILPEPFLMNTRATLLLRRPVPLFHSPIIWTLQEFPAAWVAARYAGARRHRK